MLGGGEVNKAERGAKGGYARAAVLTREERVESARKAVGARWAKERGRARRGSLTSGTGSSREQTQIDVTMRYEG